MDFLDAINSKNIAGGRTSEFVSAVASATRYSQSIHVSGLNELGRFLWIGKHLL